MTQSEPVANEFPVWLGHEFLCKVALLGGPFVCLLIFSIVSVRQSLTPITTSSREAQAINFASHGTRLSESDLPEELKPLVHRFQHGARTP